MPRSLIGSGWHAAGNWVLLEGIDKTITKTATVVPEFLDEEVHIIRPLQFHTQVRDLPDSRDLASRAASAFSCC